MAEQTKDVAAVKVPGGLESINTQSGGFMPSFRTFDEVWRWCDMVSRSNIVPKAYKGQPADIMVAVQFGSEIGLKWLQSLQSIAVVNGTPSIYGDAALALVRSSGLLEEFDEWLEVDGARQEKAVDVIALEKQGREIIQYCRSKRKGMAARTTFFGVNDAKSMKLWMKRGYNDFETPWCTSPGRMLMWRARSWNLRDNFGDVLKGISFYEEAQDLDTAQPPTTTAVIAEKSQPETKGRQVSDALKNIAEERGVKPVDAAPLATEELVEQPTPVTQEQPEVAPAEPEKKEPKEQPQDQLPGQMTQSEKAMILSAIKGSELKLRSTVEGTKKLNAILGAMKVRLSGKQVPSDVIPEEQLTFYMDKLDKALATK